MSDDNLEQDERRRAFRIDMEEELIDVSWEDDKGQENKRKIACLDFSRGGLRMDCDQEIPLNFLVTVIFQAAALNSQKLTGRVIRCLKQEHGFYEIALRLGD